MAVTAPFRTNPSTIARYFFHDCERFLWYSSADVKRGEALKLTHRVQILLYALELQALLDAEGVAGTRVDLERGAVWLGKQPQPEVFEVSAFRPHLERFLRHDLTRILSGTARDA